MSEKPVSELLEQAEHFYACAKYIREQIDKLTREAGFLEFTADGLCEANMRLGQKQSSPGGGAQISNTLPLTQHCPTCTCKDHA